MLKVFFEEFFSSSKIRRKSLRDKRRVENDRETILLEEGGQCSRLSGVSSSKGEIDETARKGEQQMEKPNPSEKGSDRREGDAFGERTIVRAIGIARRCLQKLNVELHGGEKKSSERDGQQKTKKGSSKSFGSFQLLAAFSQRGQLMGRKSRTEDRCIGETLRVAMRWKNAVQKKIARQTRDGRMRTGAQPWSVRWTGRRIAGNRHRNVANRTVSSFPHGTNGRKI